MDPLNKNLPTPPATPPAGTPPAEPTLSPETQKIMGMLEGFSDTLGGIQEQVTGLKSEWDSFKEPEPPETPPATPTDGFAPQTWDEFPAKAKEVATEVVNEALKKSEEAKAAAAQAEVDEQTNIDKDIDTKIAKLETDGVLPKIVNDNDPNDPGRRARAQVFGLASKMGTLELEQVASQVAAMNATGHFYDFKVNKWVKQSQPNPGQNAPVGSSGYTSGAPDGGPTYETIHKAKSLAELARRAGM